MLRDWGRGDWLFSFSLFSDGFLYEGLHGEHVEAAVNLGYGASDKLRGIAHQVVDGAAKLVGIAHATEGSLTDDVLTALGVAAIRVGEQRAVLLSDEEARGNGVDADALAELLGTLRSHVGSEVGDAGLGCGIATDTRHGTECCHRREVDDGTLALLHHWLEENLSGDDGACQVQLQHA